MSLIGITWKSHSTADFHCATGWPWAGHFYFPLFHSPSAKWGGKLLKYAETSRWGLRGRSETPAIRRRRQKRFPKAERLAGSMMGPGGGIFTEEPSRCFCTQPFTVLPRFMGFKSFAGALHFSSLTCGTTKIREFPRAGSSGGTFPLYVREGSEPSDFLHCDVSSRLETHFLCDLKR